MRIRFPMLLKPPSNTAGAKSMDPDIDNDPTDQGLPTHNSPTDNVPTATTLISEVPVGSQGNGHSQIRESEVNEQQGTMSRRSAQGVDHAPLTHDSVPLLPPRSLAPQEHTMYVHGERNTMHSQLRKLRERDYGLWDLVWENPQLNEITSPNQHQLLTIPSPPNQFHSVYLIFPVNYNWPCMLTAWISIGIIGGAAVLIFITGSSQLCSLVMELLTKEQHTGYRKAALVVVTVWFGASIWALSEYVVAPKPPVKLITRRCIACQSALDPKNYTLLGNYQGMPLPYNRPFVSVSTRTGEVLLDGSKNVGKDFPFDNPPTFLEVDEFEPVLVGKGGRRIRRV